MHALAVYIYNVTCKLLLLLKFTHMQHTVLSLNCRLVAVYCIQFTIKSLTSVSRATSYAKSESATCE